MVKRTTVSATMGVFIAMGLMLGTSLSMAQSGSHITAVHELGHDQGPPLDKIPALPPPAGPTQAIPLLHTHGPFAPHPEQADQALQSSATSALSTTSGKNILGVGNGFSGPQGSFTVRYIPPDTNGAAGDTQFVQWVNASFAIFDKSSGSPVYGPAAGNTLWSGFGGACQQNNSGDPVAQFDKLAHRWVMMQPVFKSPYTICVAVSTSSDATGSWYRYAFPVIPSVFPDYPKLGVWSDGYTLTYNQFQGNTFLGAAACALDRTNMLVGNAASMQCATGVAASFGSLLPSDVDGSTAPPPGSPEYFLNFDPNLASLDLWQFNVDWSNSANSTFNGPTNTPVTAFNEACGGGACIPQQGTSQVLDSLGDRLMYRLAYRNITGGNSPYQDLLVSHSVDTGNGYTGVRWYELQNPGTGWVVHQQSTYAPDSNNRWMGSIAMDKNGDIALGYSVSSSSMSPTIRYTGRVPGDPLGTMESENDLLTNIAHGSQTNYTRWGDYSSMAIDPVDDCTFWYTTEYQPTNGNAWSTRIASFAFSGCAGTPDFSISANPGSLTLTQGQSGNSTISVTALNGFAGTVNLRATGCPTSPANACTLNPTSVTGSGSSTLTVKTDSTTAAGSYTITVTGTASGGLTHSTTVQLTVNSSGGTGDFSISASPSSQSVSAGSAALYTVSVSALNGFTGTVSFSISGVPPHSTANFNPTSVTGSGNSTLTVTTGSKTRKNTYTLTITGNSGSLTHSTSVALTVH